MRVQLFVKGIASRASSAGMPAFGWADAKNLILSGKGIQSNWLRTSTHPMTDTHRLTSVLTDKLLMGHVLNYARFGTTSAFVSLAAGAVERDRRAKRNRVHHAVDTAVKFATNGFKQNGFLFYGWTIVAPNPSAPLGAVSEDVRDVLRYRDWSPYQLQGEITAKLYVPANQVFCIEERGPPSWGKAIQSWRNPGFVNPSSLVNLSAYL